VTGARRTPRSPAGREGTVSGPQRADTRARLSRAGGGVGPDTLRIFLEEATGRADQLQAEVDRLLAAGDCKGAFNASDDALRASLARESRRRPGEAGALYRFFTERNVRLVREMPGYSAEEGGPR